VKERKARFLLTFNIRWRERKRVGDKEAKKPRNKEEDKMKVEEKTALLSVRKKNRDKEAAKREKKYGRKNCTLHKYL